MKVIDFIFAARPMLMMPVWSIYLITCSYYGGSKFTTGSLLVLIGLSLLFAGAYFMNQIYDYESDLINKKLGFLQKGLIGKREMVVAYLIVSAVGLAVVCFYGYLPLLIFTGIFLLGYIYSASPFRLKDRPITGLLSNSIAYGILVPLAVPGLIDNINYSTFSLPTYFFLMVSAGYLLTIIPDREGDMKTGKKTLAVILSDREIIAVAVILLFLSVLISYEMRQVYLLLISVISLVLFVAAFIKPRAQVVLFACKLPILLMSLLAGYYYPIYLIFLLALLISTRLYYKKRFGIVYPRLG